MLNGIHAVLWLSLFVISACAISQERLPPEVTDFIQLLVEGREPTLAVHAKFSGECGGESELAFELKECRSRGWDTYSESCIAFTRQRCHAAKQESSLELNWLRERFSTVGKSYQLISVQSQSANIDLLEVEIGSNNFLLFYDASSHPPSGLVVGVHSVNGNKVTDYLKME